MNLLPAPRPENPVMLLAGGKDFEAAGDCAVEAQGEAVRYAASGRAESKGVLDPFASCELP